MWVEAAIGAVSGAVLLGIFARASAEDLAQYGYLALTAMLAVYLGAQLVMGPFEAIITEMVVASAVIILARVMMNFWLPSIGPIIFLHGLYDALAGPSTGVAAWYPPLCAGFDFVVGIGLLVILVRKGRTEPT